MRQNKALYNMEKFELETLINSVKYPKLKLICICGNFKKSDTQKYSWYKCKNCNGWMSLQMLANKTTGCEL